MKADKKNYLFVKNVNWLLILRNNATCGAFKSYYSSLFTCKSCVFDLIKLNIALLNLLHVTLICMESTICVIKHVLVKKNKMRSFFIYSFYYFFFYFFSKQFILSEHFFSFLKKLLTTTCSLVGMGGNCCPCFGFGFLVVSPLGFTV